MKKLSLVAIILLVACTVAMAQPRAIGVRLGWNIGASYQHQIGEKNMIQADIDFIAYGLWGTQGTVTFNWIIPLVSVDAGKLNLYPGVGVGGGYHWWRYGFVGVAGMVGIEWTFTFPLQLSFEYRPLIGLKLYGQPRHEDGPNRTNIAFLYKNGLWESAIAVGVRYKFGGK